MKLDSVIARVEIGIPSTGGGTIPAINVNNAAKEIAKQMLVDGYDEIVVDLKRSKGTYLYDSRRKKNILDFFNFFATAPIGYNHPRMLDKKFLDKLMWSAVNKPSNSDFYTIEMAEFVSAFGRVAKPPYMKHTFFIDGGALGVENALKSSFDWKIRKNVEKGVQGATIDQLIEIERTGAALGNKQMRGTKVLHFEESFHGRTGYTMSLTHTADPRKYMFFPKFDWPRVLNPKIKFPLEDANLKYVEDLERTSLEQIDSAIQKYPNDIACLIIEPIQGEGGDNHFRPQFMQSLRKVCDQNDMMFILDEIQAGMGLTGKMWAHEHYNIKPDMICFGKKIQTAGFMCNARIDEIKENCLMTPTRLNSTWGGNLVDFVRATRYLEIIEEEHLVKNAEVQGKLLLECFKDLAAKHPKFVSNARGKGLMCAFDTPSGEIQGRLRDEAYKRDMLILACGKQAIRLRPPLNVLEEDIKIGMEILEKCVKVIK